MASENFNKFFNSQKGQEMILKMVIYKSNPNLKKLENVKEVKYTPDGFLKYHSAPKNIEK